MAPLCFPRLIQINYEIEINFEKEIKLIFAKFGADLIKCLKLQAVKQSVSNVLAYLVIDVRQVSDILWQTFVAQNMFKVLSCF